MAEKHAIASIDTADWGHYLHKVFTFVNSTQSGIVRFAQSSHDGSTYAVKVGGSFWNGSSSISESDWVDDDYVVIEPVTQYPGGGRWQIKIKILDHDDDEVAECTAEVSWSGGYDTSSENFGSNVTTGALDDIHYSIKFTTSDDLYISCGNSDSYVNSSGTQTYTYMRVLLRDSGASDDLKFLGWYCGGYIPVEPNNDTKPVVFFAQYPRGGTSSYYWGSTSTSSASRNRCPGAYDHGSAQGTNKARIQLISDSYTGYSLSRSANWVNGPVLVMDLDDTVVLGVFGKETFLKGHIDRSSGTADSTAKYLVCNDLMMKWDTSA